MKKGFRKVVSLILACTLSVGLLSACKSDSGSGGGDSSKTDLLLWMPPNASEGDTLDQEFWSTILAPWAEENNVNLTIEITPWGNYEEKYLTGFSSGSGPDVGYMYLEMYNDFIEMGALEKLDDYFTAEEVENYLYYDKGFIKGAQYTLPFVVGNARVLYFNMDILEQAGVTELPETWDDLVAVATQIRDANIDGVIPFAQEWADPAIGALNNLYYPYLWQAGGELYNEDGTEIALMDNGAAVEAAQFLYDLKNKDGVLTEESMGYSGKDIQSLFLQNKVAIHSSSTSSAKLFDDAGINWDFVDSLEKEEKATWIAADSLVMNSACKNKELAASLMKEITSTEVMTAFHTQIVSYPPITKDEAYNDNPRFKEMYETSTSLRTLPVANNSFKMMDTLYKNLQMMMLDQLTPEQAIENTVQYANSI